MSDNNIIHLNTDWLVNYFVESPELNDLAKANGLDIVQRQCNICERTLTMPEEIGEYEGYVCIQCSDDAIHDYIERHV